LEQRLRLPTVLIVVGSASSGRGEVVSLLDARPGLRVAGTLEFLPGLCRWFPNMDRLVGSVLRPQANENAALHVRRLLKGVVAKEGPGIPVLPLEPAVDAAGHLEASTIVPALLPEAVFLLVVRHPFDELRDARARREGLTAEAFAMEWVTAAREWLGVAMRRPRESFVLVVGARHAIHVEPPSPAHAMLLGTRTTSTIPLLHLRAFSELGDTLGPVLERVGLRSGQGGAVELSSLGPGPDAVSPADRRRIVEVCGREMMALRMLTGSDFQDVVPFPDPQDEPDRVQSSG